MSTQREDISVTKNINCLDWTLWSNYRFVSYTNHMVLIMVYINLPFMKHKKCNISLMLQLLCILFRQFMVLALGGCVGIYSALAICLWCPRCTLKKNYLPLTMKHSIFFLSRCNIFLYDFF
jgi:hypothetical protein